MAWINFIYLLSLVVWIGSILFFSFVGAPTIFKTLPQAEAGQVVGAIFPKYYPLGYLSGLVSLAMVITSAIRNHNWPVMKGLILVLMLAFTIFTSLVIHPRARAYKDELAGATEQSEIAQLKTEFDRSHKTAVVNNVIVLVLGLVLLFLTARGLTI